MAANAVVDPAAITAVASLCGLIAGAATASALFPGKKQSRGAAIGSPDNKKKRRKLDHADDIDPEDTCVYLDYNGTTPIYPDVVDAMMPYLTKHFGNPSSGHAYAIKPKHAINKARKQILQLLGVTTSQEDSSFDDDTLKKSVIFTSCGTESDNLAIMLALACWDGDGLPHIVTSNVEHPAVEAYLKTLEHQDKCTVTYVPVGNDGRVKASDVIDAIETAPNTVALVTLMLANNETGALQPVKDVAEYCHECDILFHTDASQAAGKVSVEVDELGHPDFVTLAGHKLGAPKGVACLYVRPNCLEARSLDNEGSHFAILKGHGVSTVGGNQEFGLRAGTENVASIVGFGYAAAKASVNREQNSKHMEYLRELLLKRLREELGGSISNGNKNERNDNANIAQPNGPSDPSLRLPNTLSVGLLGVQSGQLLQVIGDRVAASAGATCHSSPSCGVSSVLQAMDVPVEYARGTLRLSVGPTTTQEQVERAASIIATEAKRQLAASAAAAVAAARNGAATPAAGAASTARKKKK